MHEPTQYVLPGRRAVRWPGRGELNGRLLPQSQAFLQIIRRCCQRQFSERHFIKHDSQRIHVAAHIGRLAGRDFRGHVVQSSLWSILALNAVSFFCPAGESEVRELHAAMFVQQDIFWLHVTMHDAKTCRIPQGVNGLQSNADDLTECQPVLMNQHRK